MESGFQVSPWFLRRDTPVRLVLVNPVFKCISRDLAVGVVSILLRVFGNVGKLKLLRSDPGGVVN